ncbi:hypothetical protein [Caulobacter flavus]|uniref:hypothetical protein n=1 Tax=Caulobacter flavus TaxID=1679497 RepID=UPI0013DE77ED|nr:hypothetical protein [Caulobacter flavus]
MTRISGSQVAQSLEDAARPEGERATKPPVASWDDFFDEPRVDLGEREQPKVD